MLASININKLLYVVVTICILVYLFIFMYNSFDFKEGFSEVKKAFNEISMSEIYDYLDKNSNYYYKIENSTYCLTKEELRNHLSEKFINNMEEDIIEVTYKDNMFTLKYNKDCIPN